MRCLPLVSLASFVSFLSTAVGLSDMGAFVPSLGMEEGAPRRRLSLARRTHRTALTMAEEGRSSTRPKSDEEDLFPEAPPSSPQQKDSPATPTPSSSSFTPYPSPPPLDDDKKSDDRADPLRTIFYVIIPLIGLSAQLYFALSRDSLPQEYLGPAVMDLLM
ncbi:unnamed protein product [Vitrella brassicaformis CCMP3155]|uniref:Transmembrane protein n=1 Tax=Vitrella brassicaformis (strain CCMP3155) TaxID=1169540 RepID=A0A0G4FUC0_VITBC|nr:unnamed protein product [Vitrella brassicaformis CCMP3155]|mmetsp:Transcript_38276/g.95879  ORF Transcript_38276/g.95879 Transcript_38276/m.95879 type:complete len:161 (+) Transcript_38276:1805-2287(+)|eukprot:CEM18317.1 unnamed protein product [Vitrella brassicaformis CCMP3155]